MRAVPADAPEHLKQAHRAASKRAAQHDGDETATVAWDQYCRAQGGTDCGRKAAIKLAMRQAGGLGRYGDAATARVYGVQTMGMPTLAPGQPRAQQGPARAWVVESNRRTWTIEHKHARRFDWRGSPAATAKPAQPWTRVNNCTQEDPSAFTTTPDVPIEIPTSGLKPKFALQAVISPVHIQGRPAVR